MIRPTSIALLTAPLPALVIGALVMRAAELPPVIWMQNIAAAAVGAVVFLLLARRHQPKAPLSSCWLAVALVAALAATLVSPGVQGVHRWLPLVVRLHAGALVLPTLIVALDIIIETGGGRRALAVAIATALILCAQPDAAQAIAFAAAWAIISRRRPRLLWLAPIAIATVAPLRSDPLDPVAHVEGIVGLVQGHGGVWTALSVVSLAILPVPLLLEGRRDRVALAVAAYLTCTLLAPLAGNYPVPVMGYGVSPILGYYLGAGLVGRRSFGSAA